MEPNSPEEQNVPQSDQQLIFADVSDTPPENHSSLPVARQLVVALGLLAVVFGATYAGTVASLTRPAASAPDVTIDARPVFSELPAAPLNAFDDVSITARSAFVWDVRAQRALFNKNADERLPLASITKLMTALVAYELLEDSERVDITLRAIKADGDSGFYDGELFTARNLNDLMLVSSSNDGATAISEAAGRSLETTRDPERVFIDAMNIRAEELGLSQTRFNNVTGLDIDRRVAGAYGSARDVAFLMEHIITHYPDVVSLTRSDVSTITNENGKFHVVRNTNDVVNEIPGLLASKTGYTELAGGNLVIAFNSGLNHPIIVVVLGSTQSGRFDDVLNLTERARRHYLANQR